MLLREQKRVVAWVSLVGIGFSLASLGLLYFNIVSRGTPRTAFFEMIVLDNYAVVFKFMFFNRRGALDPAFGKISRIEGEQRGEYYALILFSVIGMMFMASKR